MNGSLSCPLPCRPTDSSVIGISIRSRPQTQSMWMTSRGDRVPMFRDGYIKLQGELAIHRCAVKRHPEQTWVVSSGEAGLEMQHILHTNGGGSSHQRTTLWSIFPVIQGRYREKRSKKPLTISDWPRKFSSISVWRANPCSTEQGIQQTCSGIVEIESVNCAHAFSWAPKVRGSAWS